jgi:hypothetical protein
MAGEQQKLRDAEADALAQQPGQERPVAAGQDWLGRVDKVRVTREPANTMRSPTRGTRRSSASNRPASV